MQLLLSNNHDKLNHVVRIGTSPFMEQEDTYIAFTRMYEVVILLDGNLWSGLFIL